jgi:hypothetical protein
VPAGGIVDIYETILYVSNYFIPSYIASHILTNNLPAAYILHGLSAINFYGRFMPFMLLLPRKDYSKSILNILKKINNFLREIVAFYSPLTALRDAITAKKLEEFVVPEMAKRLGRKPNIGIVFGADHTGMELSIKHKKLRESIIKFHSMLNYPGIDTDYLNKIYELDFEDLVEEDVQENFKDSKPRYVPKLKEYEVNLFDV